LAFIANKINKNFEFSCLPIVRGRAINIFLKHKKLCALAPSDVFWKWQKTDAEMISALTNNKKQ